MNVFDHHGPVIVGVDGSPGSDAALGVAAALAAAFGTHLSAVHAVGLIAAVGGELVPANQHVAELEQLLRGAWTAPLEQFGDRIRWEAELVWGAPADVLTRLAEERAAAFVVVGSRGHRERSPELLGSTSHHVVHHCRRPVVVVPNPPTERVP